MEGNELYNSEEEPGNWSGNKASELCRVCACPNTYLIPIFEGEGLENELAMKIQKHLPIQVLELDGLPNHMCYQCASTLIAWHDLAMGCVEADNKLREWQREEQLQLQDNGEDKDDKSSEFYDTPSLESELPDIDTTKSKEPDLSTPEMQTKTLKKKIVITKVKERPSERSTIKMTIAKNPTAGPSGYTSKSQVVEELKTLEGSTQEFGVTKRSHEPFHSTLKSLEDVGEKQPTSIVFIKQSDECDNDIIQSDTEPILKISMMLNNEQKTVSTNEEPFYSIFIKTENDESEYYLCDVKEVENSVQISENACLTDLSLNISAVSNSIAESEVSGSNSNGHSSVINNSCELLDHDYVQLIKIDNFSNLQSCLSAPLITKTDMLEEIASSNKVDKNVSDTNNKTYILKCVKSQLRNTSGKFSSKSVSVNRLVSCNYCLKSFRSMAVLQTHTRIHTQITPFYCKYCGISFRLSSSLKQHLHVCSEVANLNNLYSHPLTKGNDNHYACTICGKKYKLKPSLKEHLRAHMGKARLKLKCEVCSKKFLRKADILEHMKSHDNLMLFTCEICEKGFINDKDLQDHQISHSDIRPFICRTCGATYKRKSHLTRHVLIHSEKYKQVRAKHMRKQPGEVFMCEFCSKITNTKRLLMLHMISHTGEKNHECSTCGRRFAQSGALSRHIHTVHSGAKDFTCEICHRSFTAKATKENHMRIHTGEKPYQCTVCGKTFRTQQQQHLHEKIHSDVRPFSCPYCNKCFRRRPHLVVHIRTHTGEKPYACPICGRCFAQKNDMIKHRNLHNR